MMPGIGVCVCVSTVQPESWSCCLQMLIDGNRLRSGGVLVLFWLFSYFFFLQLSRASPAMDRGANFGARCARF